MHRFLKSATTFITCFCFIHAASASSANIGIVMTTGEVQVNGTRVPGTSAIFDGSQVVSTDRASSLQFSDGTSTIMRPDTTMTVYRDRSILDQGVALQRGVGKHPVQAGELKISGRALNTSVLVGMKDAAHIEVEAQEGEAEVRTSGGTLLARLEPGNAMSFGVLQAAKGEETRISLCGDLDNQYQLQASRTGVTYQLQASGGKSSLDKYINHTISVRGLLLADTSSPRILNVLEIKKRDKPCEGAAIISGTNAAGIALLVIIAAGGALIGYGASGGFGSGSNPVTPSIP